MSLFCWAIKEGGDVAHAGVLSMFCTKCKDTDALGTDPRPRFGGIFELLVDDDSEVGFFGERWELYKVGFLSRPNA